MQSAQRNKCSKGEKIPVSFQAGIEPALNKDICISIVSVNNNELYEIGTRCYPKRVLISVSTCIFNIDLFVNCIENYSISLNNMAWSRRANHVTTDMS